MQFKTKRATPRLAIVLPLLAGALLLSACGTNSVDRTVSGAGLGAGAGATVGAIFGGVGVVPAAIVGAAVGGVGGLVSSPQQVDLGKPVWR